MSHHHDPEPGSDPFDHQAATWDDDPTKIERARVVADAIRRAVPVGANTRVLEYGAGTGLVAQHLAGHVGGLVLADTSAGMREVMEAKVASGALPRDASVTPLDLTRDEIPPDRFDLVVTVLTLHHIPDLAPVLAAFAGLLEEGGHLCIADLESEDGSFHGDTHRDVHHGFEREQLHRQLVAAGFTGVTFSHVHDLEKDSATFPMFLAVAAR